MKLQGMIADVAILFVAAQAMAQAEKPRPDWITTTNQDCKVWNPQPEPNESVTWSGPCKDGYATGQGILAWTENGKPDVRYEGAYANGKRNGHGVLILPNGMRIEGEWLNDQLLEPDQNAI